MNVNSLQIHLMTRMSENWLKIRTNKWSDLPPPVDQIQHNLHCFDSPPGHVNSASPTISQASLAASLLIEFLTKTPAALALLILATPSAPIDRT